MNKRLRLGRHSLRTLLLFVIVASIGLAVFVHESGKVRQRSALQRQFLDELGKANNPVFVVFDNDDDDAKTFGELDSQGFWSDVVWGKEACRKIESIQIVGVTNLKDDTFSKLRHFDELEYLELNYTNSKDSTLKEIAAATQLRSLVLSELEVTDRGLMYLESLVNLRRLDLFQIEGLDGSGFRFLVNLTRLNELDLYDSDNSVVAARYLENCHWLETLRLGRGKFTNEELNVLSQLPHLTSLVISDCQIDQDVLMRLSKCGHLKFLALPNSVTTDELSDLQNAMPGCRITK